MRNSRLINLLLSMITICLASCASPIPITILFTDTATPTLNLTKMTETPTRPPAPTYTPTQFATLLPDQLNTVVIGLLNGNVQCTLPCWWGIVPGKTSWQEAQSFLVSKGIDTQYSSVGAPLTPSYYMSYKNPDNIFTSFGFFTQDGLVHMIQVSSENSANPNTFQKFWMDYSPQEIISIYGKPSRVWLNSEAYAGADSMPTKMDFWIWLIYDQLGFFVTYNGTVDYAPVYHFCPIFGTGGSDIWNLNMFFVPPNDPITMMQSTQYSPGPFYHRDLEQAAGMTVDEFYALYKQTSKPICIDTPRDVWK